MKKTVTDTGNEGIGSSRGVVREYNPSVGTWIPAQLPSVAGHMSMTHADFQQACQVELGRLQEDHLCDNRLVHLLCEAVRCSRECCEIAQSKIASAPDLLKQRDTLRLACKAMLTEFDCSMYQDQFEIGSGEDKAIMMARVALALCGKEQGQ